MISESVDEVESVDLQKKGNVNISRPRQMRGSETARGQRSAENVMQVINAQYGRIMYTYNRYLRQDPNLAGKISIDLTIAAGGRVANVQVLENTLGNDAFIRDVIAILRRLTFPPISEGDVTVNLPFVFNRAG